MVRQVIECTYRKGHIMKRRNRSWRSVPKLEMAAMIDVVFLLLIFFLVTVNPVDTLAHLDVSRPRFGGGPDLSTLRIGVWQHGYTFNDKRMSVAGLDKALARLASFSGQPSIVITCEGASPHEGLVRALDLCAKNGLRKLAVASTP
jgi:biopolymer transport protein ExbD